MGRNVCVNPATISPTTPIGSTVDRITDTSPSSDSHSTIEMICCNFRYVSFNYNWNEMNYVGEWFVNGLSIVNGKFSSTGDELEVSTRNLKDSWINLARSCKQILFPFCWQWYLSLTHNAIRFVRLSRGSVMRCQVWIMDSTEHTYDSDPPLLRWMLWLGYPKANF